MIAKFMYVIKRIAKVGFISILCTNLLLSSSAFSKDHIMRKKDLKFNSNGNFKIVQFTDAQDGNSTNPRTIKLMNNILDSEKPDLVVLTGDNIDGNYETVKSVRTAIYNIAQPMEERRIPWAIAFGNHDDEHNLMSKAEMMKYYMSFRYNVSEMGPTNVDGVGNYNLPVKSPNGTKTLFNIYILDSGKYAPTTIGGYDWIKHSQINWYRETSMKLREENKKPVPSLMFFHIPLPEWKQVWDSGKAVGERNEDECSSKINSGLFSTILETGDVKGIFVGHDHTNDYMGDLYGIKLGYSRNVGFGTYGKEGFSRGGRVFLVKEADPSNFQTWMKISTDFE